MNMLDSLRRMGKVATTLLVVSNPLGEANAQQQGSTRSNSELNGNVSTLLDGLNTRSIIYEKIVKELLESPDFSLSNNVQIPLGYLKICNDALEKSEEICSSVDTSKFGETIPFNPIVLDTLDQVNKDINNQIHPITDLQQHGVLDEWVGGNECQLKGDCEEYVLCKFYTLLNLNFPKHKMRLALVENLVPDSTSPVRGHLLLLVSVNVDGVDKYLVLDNQYNRDRVYTLGTAFQLYKFISITNQMWTGWSAVTMRTEKGNWETSIQKP